MIFILVLVAAQAKPCEMQFSGSVPAPPRAPAAQAQLEVWARSAAWPDLTPSCSPPEQLSHRLETAASLPVPSRECSSFIHARNLSDLPYGTSKPRPYEKLHLHG